MPAAIEVDPSEVHSIEVDPSEVSATPPTFFQALREHLWPSAVGVIKETGSEYKNMGPQAGTVPARDARIPENAPFYGFRKTLVDLEDAAKSIYDKVTHPGDTVANDPVGVAADFGKLVSSIRSAREMAEGKAAPAPLNLDKVADAADKARDLAVPVVKGTAAAIPEIPVLPKKLGSYAEPFKAGGRAFTKARDAQAAAEVADLPTYKAPAPAATRAPEVAAPKQLAAGALITDPPADTSGVIPGWQPTILEHEPPPEAAAAAETSANPAATAAAQPPAPGSIGLTPGEGTHLKLDLEPGQVPKAKDYAAQARKVWAGHMATRLKATGVTAEDFGQMTQRQVDAVAKDIGINPSSAEKIALVMDRLEADRPAAAPVPTKAAKKTPTPIRKPSTAEKIGGQLMSD